MLKSGIPIHQALQSFSDGSEGPERDLYLDITKKLEHGLSLSEALATHPQSFPSLIVSTARIGERTGQMDRLLSQVSDLLERGENLKGKTRSALIYPAFLCLLTFVIVLLVVFFVLPKEAEFLEGMGVEMPLATRLMVSGVEILLHPVVVGVGLAGLAVAFLLARRAQGSQLWEKLTEQRDKLLLAAPGLGPVVRTSNAIRLLHGLSALLEAGASLTWSLHQLLPTLDNKELQKGLKKSIQDISAGDSPATCFAENNLLPVVAVGLVAVGEEDGCLDTACRQAASILESDLNTTLETLTSLLEPMALLFMGIVVGFVVLSTALPTAQLLQNF